MIRGLSEYCRDIIGVCGTKDTMETSSSSSSSFRSLHSSCFFCVFRRRTPVTGHRSCLAGGAKECHRARASFVPYGTNVYVEFYPRSKSVRHPCDNTCYHTRMFRTHSQPIKLSHESSNWHAHACTVCISQQNNISSSI
jgi:hypothetical protein